MVIALWNLLPKVTADAGTVDEKLVKTFDRKICGRVLPKELMESSRDSPAENSWCGKAPRGSALTLLLFFLGQLLLIRAAGRELGCWALGESWGAAQPECWQLRAELTWGAQGAPSRRRAAPAPAARRAHPPAGINRILAVIAGLLLALSRLR